MGVFKNRKENAKKAAETRRKAAIKECYGKTFNQLTFINFSRTKKGHTYCSFKCSCGKIIEARLSSIKAGCQKSCGCLNRRVAQSYIGKKIGMVTVIGDTGKSHVQKTIAKKNGQSRTILKFECECGVKFEGTFSFVKKQKVPSCGCIHKAQELNSLKQFFQSYERSARSRNYSFNLNFNDFKDIVIKACYYCKKDPEPRTLYHYPIVVNGIDRVDNTKGYDVDNIVACCKICNKMKGTLDYKTFKSQLELLSNRSNGDDYNTKTIYRTEETVGDTNKVLLLCIYDLIFKFNLQKSEVTALFKDLLDQHIEESD